MFSKEWKAYTDYADFSGCVKPSFDCSKTKTNKELFICQNNLDARKGNFFSSYCELIIQNIPENEKIKVRKIARDTIN